MQGAAFPPRPKGLGIHAEYLMKLTLKLIGATACAAAVSLTVGSAASAATVLNINSTVLNTGSCTSATGCPESYYVTDQGSGTIAVSGTAMSSFGFSDSFNQPGTNTNIVTASNFGATAIGANTQYPWNFQDNILISTSGTSVQLSAISTLTNVTDLQIRLISLVNPGTGSNFDVTSATTTAAALVGGPTVTTIINGWTNFAAPPAGVDYTATLPATINPGNYIIQIRGEAATGSSYSGTATFTPVPLPATALLLFSGVAGVMGFARRRRAIPA
jgi:hypothetical protein